MGGGPPVPGRGGRVGNGGRAAGRCRLISVMDHFVVAAWNVHSGVDGWGRPFDVVSSCRALDADVLVLAETWHPDDDECPGTAQEVAQALGYSLVEVPLGHGRLLGPDPQARSTWGPGVWSRHDAIWLDRARRRAAASGAPGRSHQPGSWGVAILTRLPVATSSEMRFVRRHRDPAWRAALVTTLAHASGPVTVVGTHLCHLSQGSPLQFRELRSLLGSLDGAVVVAGDMNLWGPPVSAMLPGFRRAALGRSWPAWRPHSQPDHILVNQKVTVHAGAVIPLRGSDHLPIRATLAIAHDERQRGPASVARDRSSR